MGNYIRSLSEQINLISSDDLWIEDKAIQQLHTTADLTDIKLVAGMPDLHPGRGYPIGAAFFSQNRIYPALIGNDIGCGMALWQTDLLSHTVKLDKLEKKLTRLEMIPDQQWVASYLTDEIDCAGFEQSLGTIGGGNHFAELQQVDHVSDQVLAEKIGLNKRYLQLLVHSGSRGLGQQILQYHVNNFGHQGLAEESRECLDYLQQHDNAVQFAKLNRYLIALRILTLLSSEGHELSDISHNVLMPFSLAGKHGWLHRKGATPATEGVVVIAGSRGDYSYIVQPIPSEHSLYSLAHGAGRKWQRSECKARLSKHYNFAQLSRTKFNSRVICQDRQLVYEEAPQAYKSIESVIETLLGAGLITLIARLKPVITYKMTKGEK